MSSSFPQSRHFGHVNWIGVRTLLTKEILRFVKVSGQTILAPVVTTLLFYAIISLALGRSNMTISGLPFDQFLAPGLIMMAVIQNAFANTSSSLLISKIQGNIVDVLMPPLTPGELTFAFAIGGMMRGIVVGVVVALAMRFFVPFPLVHFWSALYFVCSAALALSLIGILAGMWSEKFDHMAAVTNFIITPLAFLSGTFYSIERLPDTWQILAQYNPFFHMIDGMRYGVTGHADGAVLIGGLVLLVGNIGLWLLTRHLFAIGYRLKS